MVPYWTSWNLEDNVAVDIEDSMVLSFGLTPFVFPLGASGSNAGFSVPSSTVFKRFSFIGPTAPLEASLKLYRKMNQIRQMIIRQTYVF